MRKQLWGVIALLVVISMIASACATPVTSPAQGTAATAAPAQATTAAQQPTAAPAPAEKAALEIPDVETGKFNVAAVLIGPHDDGGWSQAHYDGLTYLEKNVPNTHVAYVENVPEGAEAEQVIRAPRPQGLRPDPHDLVRLHGSDRDRGRGVPRHRRSSTSAATRPTTRTSATCSAPWKT